MRGRDVLARRANDDRLAYKADGHVLKGRRGMMRIPFKSLGTFLLASLVVALSGAAGTAHG